MRARYRTNVAPKYRSDAELAVIARHTQQEAERIGAPVHVSMAESGKVYFWNPDKLQPGSAAVHTSPGWLVGVFTADCPRIVIFDSLRSRCDEIERAAA